PSRALAGRDRFALSRTRATARPTQRAGERRPHGRGARARTERRCRGARRADRRERHTLLRPVSVRPRKALGQHFLVDENILRVIERLAELAPDDVVLEVGPGLGVLTRFLAERVALVHAVEIDRSLAPHLPDDERVRLHWGDALDV